MISQARPLALPAAAFFIVVQDSLTIVKLQGPVTVLLVGALIVQALATVGNSRTAFGTPGAPWPLAWFVFWAAALFVLLGFSVEGFQNLLVWAMFPLVIGTVYALARRDSFERLYPWVRRAAVASSLIYLVQCAMTGVGSGGPPYSARGAGWLALLALAIVLPRIVLYKEGWMPAILLLATIVVSVSRTPMAIAAIMVVIAVALRNRRGKPPTAARFVTRVIVSSAAVGAVVLFAIQNVPFIQERFTNGDGVSVGGITINSSGRAVLWDLTTQQWALSPWIGHGPGTAQEMISARFPNFISHPHNEYLRILDDTGIVGMTLWGLGVLILLIRTSRALGSARDNESRVIHLGALLGIIILVIGAATDNVTIALYIPLLVGSMLGLSAARFADSQRDPHYTEDDPLQLLSSKKRRSASHRAVRLLR